MKTFTWKNTEKFGEIEANNIETAKSLLIQKNIEWTSIRKTSTLGKEIPIFRKNKKKIGIKLIATLHSLIKANISILDAIIILKNDAKNHLEKNLLLKIEAKLKNGFPLSTIFKNHPDFFDTITCELIFAGETTGEVEKILGILLKKKKEIKKLKKQLIRGLSYPSILLISALSVTFFLLKYVIPQFATLYKSFDTNLPTPTLIILSISNTIKNHSNSLLLALLFTTLIITILVKKTVFFNKTLETSALKTPFLGRFIININLLKFLQIFHLFFKAGIPIIKIFGFIDNIKLTSHLKSAIDRLKNKVGRGFSLHNGLKNEILFPSIIKHLIKTGEDTGKLEEMLEKCIQIQEEKINRVIFYLKALFEPLLLVFLSLLITGLLIALYLPIFSGFGEL